MNQLYVNKQTNKKKQRERDIKEIYLQEKQLQKRKKVDWTGNATVRRPTWRNVFLFIK